MLKFLNSGGIGKGKKVTVSSLFPKIYLTNSLVASEKISLNLGKTLKMFWFFFFFFSILKENRWGLGNWFKKREVSFELLEPHLWPCSRNLQEKDSCFQFPKEQDCSLDDKEVDLPFQLHFLQFAYFPLGI